MYRNETLSFVSFAKLYQVMVKAYAIAISTTTSDINYFSLYAISVNPIIY